MFLIASLPIKLRVSDASGPLHIDEIALKGACSIAGVGGMRTFTVSSPVSFFLSFFLFNSMTPG